MNTEGPGRGEVLQTGITPRQLLENVRHEVAKRISSVVVLKTRSSVGNTAADK
jgi:hypothetical protein